MAAYRAQPAPPPPVPPLYSNATPVGGRTPETQTEAYLRQISNTLSWILRIIVFVLAISVVAGIYAGVEIGKAQSSDQLTCQSVGGTNPNC